MNDFAFDVMQKASIARSARNKVASVKGGTGCRLPCDNMTPAQIRKLSGEPETYRLDKPMTWLEFKAMPEDLRKKYLRDLQLKYGANDAALATMFGVRTQTVLLSRRNLGIPSLGRGGSGKMSARQEEAWQTFLEGGEPTEESSCEEPIPTETEDIPKVKETPERMCLDGFTACVTGQYSPEALLAILGTMPAVEGRCTIRIEVTRL